MQCYHHILLVYWQEVDDSLTWDFVPWLKSITKLPVIIKVRIACLAVFVLCELLQIFL